MRDRSKVVTLGIGGNEIDPRERILQMVEDIRPVRVGGECAAVGVVGVLDELVIDLLAELVPGRQADVAAARDIDGREVERLAEQDSAAAPG